VAAIGADGARERAFSLAFRCILAVPKQVLQILRICFNQLHRSLQSAGSFKKVFSMRLCAIALCLNLVLSVPALAAGTQTATDVHTTLVAAYQGSGVAQYQLALMLMTGKGLNPDMALAVNWLQCAANQGVPDAQFQLAQLELENQAPGGKTAAYKWLLLSEGKNEDRIALRKQVEAGMRPELVSIIGKQAATWRPKISPLTPYVKGKRPPCFDDQVK
jgi:hypothetical protein